MLLPGAGKCLSPTIWPSILRNTAIFSPRTSGDYTQFWRLIIVTNGHLHLNLSLTPQGLARTDGIFCYFRSFGSLSFRNLLPCSWFGSYRSVYQAFGKSTRWLSLEGPWGYSTWLRALIDEGRNLSAAPQIPLTPSGKLYSADRRIRDTFSHQFYSCPEHISET